MEPNNQKQGDAASSKPTADLEARLRAMGLGAPSPPPLNPQQELAAPVEQPPPPRLPPSPPTASQQPEAPSYGGVGLSLADHIGSSTRVGLSVDDLRRSTRVWLLGLAPGAPDPSVAPKRRELSVDAESYHPTYLSRPSVMQSSSTSSFSASQGRTSAGARRSLTLEEYQALRRFRGLVPGDEGSAGSSACLVRLLKEGCEEVREGVLDRVKGALHFVMGSRVWRDVFVELLGQGSFDELRVIVDVACKGDVSVMRIANNECWVESLMDLFTAVKPHSHLRQNLVNWLLNDDDGGLFHHSRSQDLLRSIFTTFFHEESSAIIDCALGIFRDVLGSKSVSDSMVECFAVADGDDLRRFEKLILSNTVEFATGMCSNHFLQGVLERSKDDQFKEEITQRVLDNLVSLSMDLHGSFVVQACFVRTGSALPQLLERVLERFQGLPREELDRLVRNTFAANNVVSKLLLAGKDHFLDKTRALAWTIKKLPAAGLDLTDVVVRSTVGKVMKAVEEVLS